MKITPIIKHLRQYCPSFGSRIAGALDFNPAKDSVSMAVPCAFVILTGDDAEPSIAQNAMVQAVTDEFDVVVVLKTADERGQEPADHLHGLRAELWRALIGWVPMDGYEPIEYVSGELLVMSRASLYYRFSFKSEMTVGNYAGLGVASPGQVAPVPETWQEYELAALPFIESLGIEVDVIDPITDANITKPGPDGRIEFRLNEEYPHE
jgi:hypothetical protein